MLNVGLLDMLSQVTWVDFASNLLAGIVGSIMTWIIVAARRKLLHRRQFSDYAGWYDHYSIDDNPIENEQTRITWMGGNVIRAEHTKPGGRSWTSHIVLNEAVPHVGSGFYQYNEKADCGVHQIQRDLSRSKIYVLVTNTSHGKSYTVSYVWKRAGRKRAVAAT